MKKEAPLGIDLLSYIYLLNVVLFLSSLLLFESRVLVFGKEANIYITWLIRLCLVLFPIYLALRLSNFKKDGFFLAIFFHVFFLINNGTSFLESAGFGHTLVRITGLYGLTVYSPTQIFVLILNTLLNTFILGYLVGKRKYFLNLHGGKNG